MNIKLFDGEQLELNVNEIRFNRIQDKIFKSYQGKVYDLEIENIKNYHTKLGIAHNGGGKRRGAVASFLEVWHGDVEEWLLLKRNIGSDQHRARNLFYAAWIPDLFMYRVENDDNWSLFDPNTAPGLADCFGEEFNKLYTKYEEDGRAVKTIKAQELWKKILETQIETSMPYILYKDAVNRKSNQSNLGTIKSSNLCAEIIEFTSPEEIAVCNLASISLPAYLDDSIKIKFNHKKLYEVVKTAIKNLNKVIDVNYYPLPEAKKSNFRHRPIGLGVQGLADVFMKLRVNWDSLEVFTLNREIFETIYYAALEASMEEAIVDGVYETYVGSPASNGQLQFDLWFNERIIRWNGELNLSDFEKILSGDNPKNGVELYCTSKRYDWNKLKEKIQKHGLRNSLLLANMPTASTSNILGNTESFEPIPSNIYKRNVLSGEFIRINKYLVADLQELGLWNDEMKQKIIAAEGSIQLIDGIPDDIKQLYRNVQEIRQRNLIDLCADRGAFICQSQSLNIYMSNPTFAKLTSMHFYGWKKGLKTGSYYIRQQAARQAQKFTVDVNIEKEAQQSQQNQHQQAIKVLIEAGWTEEDLKNYSAEDIITMARGTCSTSNPEDCEMCGS